MKYRGLFVLILFCLFSPLSLMAQDMMEEDPFSMSEDEMFADMETVEEVDAYQDENITQKFDEGTFGITTELSGTASYGFATDKAANDTSVWGHKDTNSITLGQDLLIDGRWKYGMKFFSDIYITWTPTYDTGRDSTADTESITVRELFGDFNIAQKVYFRIGKQTLKWGKGYFWNPTDLISTDRKDFNNLNARREGSTGMKIQVPFGTDLNIYTFFDATKADTLSDSAFAGKVEMLVGNYTELSFSGWTKKGYKPVYGFDFSTYALDTQWRGELSVSKGGNQHYFVNGTDYYDPDEIITQASFGFTKTFDIGDINDRLSLTGEFLYNPKGYDDIDILTLYQASYVSKQDYLFPMYHGKAYAGFFLSFARFLGDSDLTYTSNSIFNFSDKSGAIANNVSYLVGYDTTLTLGLKNFVGDDAAEFTYLGNHTEVSLSFSTTL